jgi:flagellar biogenesis protein FliO/SH3-like domain-containing protein
MSKYIRALGYILILTVLCATNLFAAANATVIWKYVNLRETPSRKAQIITKLVEGVSVSILEEEDEWYKIKSEEEIVGWLVKESVKVTKAPALGKTTAKKIPVKKETAKKAPPKKAEVIDLGNKSPVVQPLTKKAIKSDTDQDGLLTYQEKKKKKKNVSKKEDKTALKKKEAGQEKEEESYFQGATAPDSEMLEFPSMTSSFLRMISALLIILGVILLLYYIVRKYFSKSLLAFEGSSAISILASKYIGQKTILYVIDFMEKIVVVAISGSDIKVLTEIADTAAVDRMRTQITKLKESEKPFKRFFFDKVKTKSESQFEEKDEKFDILDDLNEKIKKKTDELKV